MARAVIIIEDGEEFTVDLKFKFFKNDESKGLDNNSQAHRVAAWAIAEITKELQG